MTNDRKIPTQPDRKTIDVGDDDDVQYWSREFGVTPDQLKAVVLAVGSSAEAVRANLQAASTSNEPLTQSGDQRIAAEE